MKLKSRKLKFVVIVISIIILICGCTENKNKTEVQKDSFTLSKGSYISKGNDTNTIYSMNNDSIYENVNTEDLVVSYNSESGNYIFVKDNEVFINYLGEDIKIDDEKIKSPKLSNDGNFLFYFCDNGILEPKVIDLKNKAELIIDNKAMISGQFVDWVSDNTLIYYGIRNDDKKSGIFTYDLTNKKESLVYEIKKGYVSFLKAIDDEVVFIEDNMENKKILISLNNDNSLKEITEKVIDLKDIIKIDNNIYVLGKVKDDVYSIYEIVDNDIHRVVYDFPLMINLEKGLSVSPQGEFLFMGSNNDYNEQNIYKYSNGAVELISKNPGRYTFININ